VVKQSSRTSLPVELLSNYANINMAAVRKLVYLLLYDVHTEEPG
jgi:hypothetical protein